MKRFSSYGPPNPQTEFMVQRPELVGRIAAQLVGTPEDLGHYFTIFAPRQVGKTTTLRQVVEVLRQRLGNSFHVGMATMHGIKDFRIGLPTIFKLAFDIKIPRMKQWVDVQSLFSVLGPLKKPTILILDEFDGLPGPELAETIATFRQLYLERQENHLHGLALIGVHSVLGELTSTVSPFNIQRSVRVPNLTREEVIGLYGQYIGESSQEIAAEGIERIWEMFRGQPGLTCWFGELLTEKYNLVQPPPCERKEGPPPDGYPLITEALVQRVINDALYAEININIRNLISKGMQHQELLQQVFVSHELAFDLNVSELQWLYLNGILVGERDPSVEGGWVCAFASPFVQRCLFSAFGQQLKRAYSQALLYEPDEPVALGFAVKDLDVPGLLSFYRKFLARQLAKGAPPWSEQPARSDARPFEAIGHFNLYAWLYGVAKGGYTVVPEFPTGNGTADLVLKNHRRDQQEVLEVKSFTTTSDLDMAVTQAARYAKKLKLSRSFLVVMADASAFEMLRSAPTQHEAEGISVKLEIIPWGFWPEKTQERRPEPRQGTKEYEAPSLSPPGSAHTQTSSGPEKATPKRNRAHPSVTLTLTDRLALEALVAPLLTPERFALLCVRLDLEPSRFRSEGVEVGWSKLIQKCLAKGRGADLSEVLRFTFPELVAHPLVEKLRE